MSEHKMNIEAIGQALESGLSTSVYEIYIPSMKKKVPFKPLLTGQCKTMAKIMIEANEKPFDTFRAVVAMINVTCMEDIDMNTLTELDRVKVMLEFYMNNNILKDFDLACPKCGVKNKIKINLDDIVEKMNHVNVDDITFVNEQNNELTCTVAIPTLPIMHMFYELVQDGKLEMDDIACCFIKDLKLEFSNTEVDPIEISLLDFEDIMEYVESIRLIPYVITINDKTGESIFEVIMGILDAVMTDNDEKHICTKCKFDFGEVASAQNFI